MELDLERELPGLHGLVNDSGCRFFPHSAIFESRTRLRSDVDNHGGMDGDGATHPL